MILKKAHLYTLVKVYPEAEPGSGIRQRAILQILATNPAEAMNWISPHLQLEEIHLHLTQKDFQEVTEDFRAQSIGIPIDENTRTPRSPLPTWSAQQDFRDFQARCTDPRINPAIAERDAEIERLNKHCERLVANIGSHLSTIAERNQMIMSCRIKISMLTNFCGALLNAGNDMLHQTWDAGIAVPAEKAWKKTVKRVRKSLGTKLYKD